MVHDNDSERVNFRMVTGCNACLRTLNFHIGPDDCDSVLLEALVPGACGVSLVIAVLLLPPSCKLRIQNINASGLDNATHFDTVSGRDSMSHAVGTRMHARSRFRGLMTWYSMRSAPLGLCWFLLALV